MVIFHCYVSSPEGNLNLAAINVDDFPKNHHDSRLRENNFTISPFLDDKKLPKKNWLVYPLVNLYIAMENAPIFHG